MTDDEHTDPDILMKVQTYVQGILLETLSPVYLFHNLEHTKSVVQVAETLATAEGLSPDATEQLKLAAWFHDVGMVEGFDGHEERSAETAKTFLTSHNYPKEKTDQVISLILSTRAGAELDSLSEKILHDADWSFLGRKRFSRVNKLLRLEKEQTQSKKYSLHKWSQKMLDMQLAHTFQTVSGRNTFLARQHKNIAEERKQLIKAKTATLRRKTGKDFGRGIDTVYRTTLRNHINLSTIADGKANMIISINTLVLSILITAATAGASLANFNLAGNIQLIAPILVLMITSLIAIIFAVLLAIPKVGGTEFTQADIDQKKVSLLFFGNFLKIPKDQFVGYLRDLKKDQEILYDDLSRDLYNLGLVLRKKYRLLTIAYRVFIAGLVLSVAVFLVISLF